MNTAVAELDETLSAVVEGAEKRQRTKERAWRALVADIEAGKKPADERVETVMQSVNRTHDDLRAAVDLLRQRKGWARKISDLRAIVSERPEILREHEQRYTEFREIEKKFEELAGVTTGRLNFIAEAELSIGYHVGYLERSCVYPEIDEELAECRAEIARVGPLCDSARLAASKRQEGEYFAKQAAGGGEHSINDTLHGERLLKAAREADAALPALEKQMKELQQREAEIIARKLLP